ncbi:MAG: ATP-binding protein, partial [archaeon]
MKKKLEKLKDEKIKSKEQKKLKEINDKINKVEKKKEKLSKLKTEKKDCDNIKKEDINKLRRYKDNISKTKASLEAAKLIAKINFSASKKIEVQRGIDNKEIVDSSESIKANGYLRIITDDIDLEIESAEINFEKLNNEYKSNKKDYKILLEKLNVNNLLKAEEKYEKLKNIDNNLIALENSIEEILDDESYEKLKELRENYSEEKVKSVEEINKEIEKLREEKINELRLNIKTKEEKIKDWKDEYDSYDKLMDKLVNLRSEIKEREEKLQNLAELPEMFERATEFKKELSNLRKRKEVLDNKFNIKREKLLQLENDLGDNSYEELKKIYDEKKKCFNKLVTKAKKVLKIKKVIKNKVNELDENFLEPLVKSFNKKIEILTANNYNSVKIEDDFSIKINNKYNSNLPANLDLLSFGTYDAVALALRFAVFENLFKNKTSFIILDDCLVNLDPERRKKAINLINNFKNKYQIIFSTCNPQTAKELGGN